MTTVWSYPDFDAHESVNFITDQNSGLRAIIAIHDTHLGPAAGGVRFWHYVDNDAAVTDALRLSRGMSYKNAMAGLPMGGGKAVILSDAVGTKTSEMLAAFGAAVEQLGGRYVTAQDVGMSNPDMVSLSKVTRHVCGLPTDNADAGGDPGPFTALGVYLGIKAAAQVALGVESMKGVHVAIQGVGSVGGGTARHLAAEGAKLTLADADQARAEALAAELGADVVPSDSILSTECDVLSPCALGAILTEQSIAAVRAPVIAGGANNQLATPADGERVRGRGILYAPDYVINAGGIINVALQYLGQGSRAEVESRIHQIPGRLKQVWDEAESDGAPASMVADRIAQRLIGR